MTVTAQSGIFSFGGQSAKETIAATFYQHKAADIDLAAISDDRIGPAEVGGLPTPTFPYRAGIMVAGGATIYPRLEDTFGWLLYGAAGAVSTDGDTDVFGTTVTGFTSHTFSFTTDYTIPWMSFRKYIPGAASAVALGESYVDSKIVSLAIAFPNDMPLSARVDAIGRTPAFDDDPSWTYGNTQFEDYQSIPVACVTGGFIKIPGYSATGLPIVAGNVVLINQPVDIRQEKVYGSPYLEDVTIVGRRLSVDLTVKWTDPELYLSILTGATNGTQWTSAPFVSNLDMYALSTGLAVGTTPYQLRVVSQSVMYQLVGGIRLAGNASLMMRLQGTAIAPTSGAYYTIALGNAAAGYTWPT